MPTPSSKKPSRAIGRIREYWLIVAGWLQKTWRGIFGERNVHRSFRRTRRRDAVRPLKLPGYIAFTFEVFAFLRKHKKIFLSLALVYLILYVALVGFGSQATYASLVELFNESLGEAFQGASGAISQAGLLFVTIAVSGLTENPSEVQQVFSVLLFIMLWLAAVWLARNLLAGKKVKMRDGLYMSGTPLFATVVVAIFIALQLIPVGIAFIGYSLASSAGLLVGGVEAMLFWAGATLLGILSLYWIVGSFFASIIVTIPGTYPLWSMHTSNKLVAGRRVPLLLRMVWLVATIVATWAAVLLPAVLLDMGLKQLVPALSWLPIVPVALLVLTVWSALWSCLYVYLLYRKVVDNEVAE